jgi:hypothetical protein
VAGEQGHAMPPAVTDPVVVDGVKYRIRKIGEKTVQAKTSFGDDWVSVALADLTWDKVAGVWRVAA